MDVPTNHTYSLQPHGGILLPQTTEKLYQLLGSIGGRDDDLDQLSSSIIRVGTEIKPVLVHINHDKPQWQTLY